MTSKLKVESAKSSMLKVIDFNMPDILRIAISDFVRESFNK
jgi:hypothetical protein